MSHSVLPEHPVYFATDGGLETTLIFENQIDLPLFAAFPLIETQSGEETLRAYFETYIEIAKSAGWGFVLESATWRASSDWGDQLGYNADQLADANRRNIELLQNLKARHATSRLPMIISGCPELGTRRRLMHSNALAGIASSFSCPRGQSARISHCWRILADKRRSI
ncbi:MAG: homocysteine S-methyltransferase family protein [Alphaproteobacteria bacterium]|nr:homocysteine S-methyltransferase family protein [Alphaproteobacteria bacterium]